MIYARVDKGTFIVLSVEVASPEWVAEWSTEHKDDPCLYVAADTSGEYAAGIGWTFDESTGRYIPPIPAEAGTWEFNREQWLWIDLDAPLDIVVDEVNDSQTTGGDTPE